VAGRMITLRMGAASAGGVYGVADHDQTGARGARETKGAGRQ
jgi:hypothetical protein